MIKGLVAFLLLTACWYLSSCTSMNYLFNRNDEAQQFIIVKKFPDQLEYMETFLRKEMNSKSVESLIKEKNGDTTKMLFQLKQEAIIRLNILVYRCRDTTKPDSKNNILMVGKIDPLGKTDTLLYQRNAKKLIDISKRRVFFFWKVYRYNY